MRRFGDGQIKRPELSWSIFHSRELDLDYARSLIGEAVRYGVDSLELCGGCHGQLQGMEGGIFYEAYPGGISKAQAQAVRKNIGKLRALGKMAHGAGLPLYYWHREVCVPPAIVKLVPRLLDNCEEFDLLGEAYQTLLARKLNEFIRNVPEVDGIVLTLTEADYSVIHNSRPDLYPAARVVESLIRIFSRIHRKLGKRFILRSFGSIEQDHRDLFAGVAAAADEAFEVETKVTPFDWNPHLPLNRWLGPLGGQKVSVEMDAMGEYFAPGVVPSPCPEEMLRYLRHALAKKVDRIALRIDRCEAGVLGSIQEVNLHAVSGRLRSSHMSVAEAWKMWADAKIGSGLGALAALMRRNFEVLKLSRYIDGSLIFHTYPISPSLEFLKLGGIFALFQPGVSLRGQRDMWSIRSRRDAPAERSLIEEKEEAVRLARQLLGEFKEMEPAIGSEEGRPIRRLLENSLEVAILLRALCETIQAYFRDLRAGSSRGEAFWKKADASLSVFRRCRRPEVIATHAQPMISLVRALKKEYRAEFRARAPWLSRRDVADFVICGGLLDEWRVRRLLHGSGSRIVNRRQERSVGNPAFPNGFLEYDLRANPGPACLIIQSSMKTKDRLLVEINRAPGMCVDVPKGGEVRIPIANRSRGGRVRIRIRRGSSSYPWLHAVAILQSELPER